MRKMFYAAVAAALAFGATTAQAADTINFNSTPADNWFYGTGNGYAPANTAVLSTVDGWQLYLRAHQTYDPAPASTGSGVYSFALGTTNISFDWGLDSPTGSYFGTPTITLMNLGNGWTSSYNMTSITGNDNVSANGSTQNSARLNWFPIGFNPNVNDTYKITMDAMSAEGSPHSLSVYAKVGSGVQSAVPEPATWAMMLFGFGAIGMGLRRNSGKKPRLKTATV